PAQKPTDGNYVSSFYIDFEPKRADENLRAVEQALRAGISRYADGSRLLAGLTSEIGMAIGRRPLGYVISKLAARDAVTSETFQISNLGRTDGFDRGKVKVISIVPVFRCFDLFAIVIGMSDHVMVTLSYPREVISEEAMRSLGRSLDDVVAELAAQPAEAVAVESGTV
ncbi:MAG: hypothetical protein H5U40_07010, partial [Polyangiaceae bacterium]|nr:hypothetical protein [Polyangiaceae bacterium]